MSAEWEDIRKMSWHIVTIAAGRRQPAGSNKTEKYSRPRGLDNTLPKGSSYERLCIGQPFDDGALNLLLMATGQD
ncbi:unnamed protein product [Protopolystoma xenopodis]|uniref:Uncharacterized protein n=1 Tax=Protopolystoma xenopodis TaxID=117903 RepID=A0A448X557_9PLAT|nr:unnamed protein product [Protopolystoma xenopodis]